MVKSFCADKPCPARNSSDCARARARPTFFRELADDVGAGGAQLTVLLAYEKLPTPFEGGHVRVRQVAARAERNPSTRFTTTRFDDDASSGGLQLPPRPGTSNIGRDLAEI